MDLTEAEFRWFKRKKTFLEKLAELRRTSRPSFNENLEFSIERKYPKVGPDYFQRFPSREVIFERLDVLEEVSSLVEKDGSISEENESIVSMEGSLDRVRIKDPKGKGRMDQKWRKILTSVLGPKRAATLVGSDSSDSEEESGSSSDEKSANEDEWTGEALHCDKGGGVMEKNRIMVYWTKSRYEGQWNKDFNVPHGLGMYTMPHGVTYVGGMHDGRFHGMGVLRYPNGATVEGVWNHGRIHKSRITFPDGLRYKENDWDYCSPSDRRFHIERLYGLGAAGRSHLTQQYPSRRIPAGCYDTADGYYNHATRCVYSAVTGKVLRIATNKEADWIMKNCRKGWDENVNYEPDIFADVRDEKDLEALIKCNWKRKSCFGGKMPSRRSSVNEHRDNESADVALGKSASSGQNEKPSECTEAPEYEIPSSDLEKSLKRRQDGYSNKMSDVKEYVYKLIENLQFRVNKCEECDKDSISNSSGRFS